MSEMLDMLATGEVPVRLRCPVKGEYLFVSNDKKKGDRVVEAHKDANDNRNEFVLVTGANGRFRLRNRARGTWVFVSNDKDGADHVVEAHSDAHDERNEFDVQTIDENRFRFFSPHYDQYVFVSNTRSGSDDVVEAHRAADEERSAFVFELPEPLTYTLKDMTYGDDLSAILDEPSEWHQTVIDNPLDTEATLSGELRVKYTTEQTWTSQAGVKAGISTTIQAGIPNIAEGKISVSAEASYSRMWGETRTEEREIAQTITTPVASHSKVTANYRLWVKRLNIPYSGTLVVHYEGPFGPGDYEQKVKGVYRGVAATRLEVQFTGSLG